MPRAHHVALGVTFTLMTVGTAAQMPGLADLLARVGERVDDYYGRARSIICTEKVTVQAIRGDMTPEGFARILEYELRVEWQPSAYGVQEATAVRQLRRINGRTARPDAEPQCLDPPSISPEPLAFLMPGRRDDYLFSLRGMGRDRNRPALLLDYRSRTEDRPEVTWTDECARVSLPGWTKGQVWVDPATYEVLRIDEGLTKSFDYKVPYERVRLGMGEYWVLERLDSSVRYRPVVFHDPDETVLLPESIDSLVVFRGPGVTGHRTTQTFSDYRRFITGTRIVK